jgi:hypothetical protein
MRICRLTPPGGANKCHKRHERYFTTVFSDFKRHTIPYSVTLRKAKKPLLSNARDACDA